MSEDDLDQHVSAADLVAALASRTPEVGGNPGAWPGLTLYRYEQRLAPTWDEIRSLSLGIVARGAKAVVVDGKRYVYDPFHYLVLGSNLQFQAEIVEAPFLSFVLELDPALVRRVSATMTAGSVDRVFDVDEARQVEPGVVSRLDAELMTAVLRFLHTLDDPVERRVLAPMHIEEVVFRVLRREQFSRMVGLAALQTATGPIAESLAFAEAHFAEPLTVDDLARRASLSPSAFTRAFRAATGRSPHRFLKELRLDRARELLVDGGTSVADASRQVGYSSVSHFIKEFRTRHGVTPRELTDPRRVRSAIGCLQRTPGD